MDSWAFFISATVGFAVCGILTGLIAVSKRRNPWLWLVCGFVLGPLGLVAAGLMEPIGEASETGAKESEFLWKAVLAGLGFVVFVFGAYLGLRAYDASKVSPLEIEPAPVYTPAQRAALQKQAEAFVSKEIKEMKNAGSERTDEQWEKYRKEAIQQYIDAAADTAITASRRAKGGI